jgi:hypothetical protein
VEGVKAILNEVLGGAEVELRIELVDERAVRKWGKQADAKS